MTIHDISLPAPNDAPGSQARALALSLVAIRRAQGKANPGDFEVGTPEWQQVMHDFALDVLRAPRDVLAQVGRSANLRSKG